MKRDSTPKPEDEYVPKAKPKPKNKEPEKVKSKTKIQEFKEEMEMKIVDLMDDRGEFDKFMQELKRVRQNRLYSKTRQGDSPSSILQN